LRHGVTKALAYVNVGLEIQSGGIYRAAAQVLGDYIPGNISSVLHRQKITRVRGRPFSGL